jgi:hypothetical protein
MMQRMNHVIVDAMFGRLKDTGADWISGWKRRSCDHPGCKRWITTGHLKARGVGVSMGDAWYCSYSCFHYAAEHEFLNILAPRQPVSGSKPRMSLGLELVGRGLLTASQLRSTTEQRVATGRDTGQLLIENGFVNEVQVTAARAAIWGCPVYHPPPPNHRLGIHLPPTLAAACQVLPIHYVPSTRQLLLGFLRNVDYELLFAVEKMTGCTAKACFLKPSDFYLHESYSLEAEWPGASAPMEMIFERTHGSSDRARILCNYGAGLDANRVKMTACGNYLWARLDRGQQTSDLLFAVA